MIGGILIFMLGVLMVIDAIAHIGRDAHTPSSPFRWIELFCGLVMAGFGVILLSLD